MSTSQYPKNIETMDRGVGGARRVRHLGTLGAGTTTITDLQVTDTYVMTITGAQTLALPPVPVGSRIRLQMTFTAVADALTIVEDVDGTNRAVQRRNTAGAAANFNLSTLIAKAAAGALVLADVAVFGQAAGVLAAGGAPYAGTVSLVLEKVAENSATAADGWNCTFFAASVTAT